MQPLVAMAGRNEAGGHVALHTPGGDVALRKLSLVFC